MYENLLQYEEIKDNDQLVSEMIKILLETYTFWYPIGKKLCALYNNFVMCPDLSCLMD